MKVRMLTRLHEHDGRCDTDVQCADSTAAELVIVIQTCNVQTTQQQN